MFRTTEGNKAFKEYLLFMSWSERSLRVLFGCSLDGVPVLEGVLLLGVSDRDTLGLRSDSEPEESRQLGTKEDPPLILFRARSLATCWMSSGPSGETATGSASELCLTKLRLCALTRDQLVERKLSASSQKRTRWSAPRCSMK